MADNPNPIPPSSGDDKPKLPPRSGDWHSGMSKDEVGRPGMASKPGVHTPHPDEDTINGAGGQVNVGGDAKRTKVPADGAKAPAATAIDPAGAVKAAPATAPVVTEPTHEYTVTAEPATEQFFTRRTKFSDFLLALLLAIAATLLVVSSYRGIGHSWDEALYLKPAESAAAWMQGVFNSGDDSLLKKEAVDRHWGKALEGPYDPLHPEVAPVPKLLNGAGLTYLTKLGYKPMIAMRLPTALLFGLTVALIYLLGAGEYGRAGGLAAAIMYGTLPRVFGHAHIGASETALAFFVVLTVYFYLLAIRYHLLALFTGIAFGLAVATKISALMLPLPLLLWGQIYKRRDYASNMFALVFIAPIAMLAVWPWLWYDGFMRFFSYLSFYVNHQHTAVSYMGRVWGYTHGPAAPFYYPLHITALVTPIWILVFLALGLLIALFSTVRRPATVLFALLAVCWLGMSMLPNAPKYDGERLFFPAFAFIALLAGGGFAMVFAGIDAWRRRRGHDVRYDGISTAAGFALLIFGGYGAAIVYLAHPNELNYYNEIIGGTKGAYKEDFETSYWGEAINEDVVKYLNATLKPGDKVKTLALNDLALENLRNWGMLPKKVDFSPDEPPYDYVIMQVRQGFMMGVERRLLRTAKPIKEFGSVKGVPQILIYDGKAVGDIWGVPAEVHADSVVTTSTQELTVDDLQTSPARMLPSLVTTGTESAALDELTSASEMGSVGTTQTMVLDLPTSTSETTATEERLSTVAVELLTQPAAAETSVTQIYEGTPPTTNSLLIDLAE